MDSIPLNFYLPRPLRVYEVIWKKLRQEQEVVLVLIDPMFLNRVKRMLEKEKNLDQGFKLANIEKFRLRYTWDAEKRELTVKLKSRFNLTQMVG